MPQDSLKVKDIDRLRKELEKQLDWGPVTEWHSSIFTELSDRIFSKCKIVLSPVTLKRFWGVVKYEGSPSISTLDALCQYLDYENWRAFRLSKPGWKKKRKTTGPSFSKKSLYVTAGFFSALLVILLVSNKSSDTPVVFDAISFSSRPVTNSYPNSVVFDFDIKEVDADSLYIQQYWDQTKTIGINRNQGQATGIYYFPGYFRAKLVIDGRIAREHDLFLRSNGWMGTVEYEPIPKYFDPRLFDENGLSYPPELSAEIRNSEQPLVSVYHYIDDLGNVSGDNFSLSAKIKVDWSEKWAVCQAVWIYVIGSGGAMIIPFSKTGCSSDNDLLLNDVFLSGKEHDLSAFGTDFSESRELGLTVRDQVMHVTIQGKEVFKAGYKDSMGRLVGLRFKFLGLGEVETFNLKDQTGQDVLLR